MTGLLYKTINKYISHVFPNSHHIHFAVVLFLVNLQDIISWNKVVTHNKYATIIPRKLPKKRNVYNLLLITVGLEDRRFPR